jgi:hypothetical protein
MRREFNDLSFGALRVPPGAGAPGWRFNSGLALYARFTGNCQSAPPSIQAADLNKTPFALRAIENRNGQIPGVLGPLGLRLEDIDDFDIGVGLQPCVYFA